MKIIKLFVIILVPAFFYLNPFLSWSKDLIYEAAGHGLGVLAFFDVQKTGQPAVFFWGHTSYLLGQVTLMITYLLFGVSTLTTILNTSMLAVLTILIVFYFVKRLAGFAMAFLALLLFSGSLFFLMVIKTAYPFYGTGPSTASLTIFLFLLAHHEKKEKFLWFSGVAMALVGLSGGQTTPLISLILLLFLIWKIIYREKIFTLKKYLLTGLITLSVFFGFHGFFPLVNHNQPFAYLADSYRLLSERGGQVKLVGNNGELGKNTERLLKAFFKDMNVPRQGHQHFLAGRAMLPLPLSLFFLWGIIIAFRKRSDLEKMLLLWSGTFFFFYGLIADFQIRYFVVAAPAVYGLTAMGIIHLLDKINSRRYLKISFSVLLSVAIGFYLFKTYDDYYVVLAKQAFKLEQYEGQAETAAFIKKNYSPRETLLIMGNLTTIRPQNLLFYTWKNPFDFYYWNSFNEKVNYTPVESEVVRGKNEEASFSGEKFLLWEREKLKSFPRIVYVFGFYNIDKTPTREWQMFRQIRPYLRPKKAVFAASGLPQIGIYEVTPEINEVESRQFKLKDGEKQQFLAAKDGKIKSLVFQDSSEKPTFFLNGIAIKLPIKTFFSQKMILNFEGKSELSLLPSFNSENFNDDVYRQENIAQAAAASLVFGGEKKAGELVYRLEGPNPIEKLNILFFPRILHDQAKKNYLSLSYSFDDRNYQKLYELKSDGTGGWIGLWEKQERLMIYPQNKVVYLKFILSGQQAQLLSSEQTPMSFEGEFNWQVETMQVKAGENLFWQTGGQEPLSLALFFE